MMEYLGKKGRSSKSKPKPVTIKEEKDIIRDLQKSYATREDLEEEGKFHSSDLFEDFDRFLKKPKTEIIRTLEACIEWLNHNEEDLNDAAVRLIDERLQSHAKKSQVFFVVAVQKRMESLLRIMEAADLIETRLLDPANIWDMPVDELRKTLELIEKKSELILKQVAVMVEQAGGFPKQFRDESKIPKLLQAGNPVLENPDTRDSVRSRLDSLLSQAKNS